MSSIYGNGGDLLLNIIDVVGTLLIIAFMVWIVRLCFEEDK